MYIGTYLDVKMVGLTGNKSKESEDDVAAAPDRRLSTLASFSPPTACRTVFTHLSDFLPLVISKMQKASV